MTAPPLLEARDLTVRHRQRSAWLARPAAVDALRGVSLQLTAGQRLAVVGESGSGKSTLVRALLRLVRPHSGQALIAGSDLAILSSSELRAHRRRVQLVFQDPVASLDPMMSVARIIEEPLWLMKDVAAAARREQVAAQMQSVGLSPDLMSRRPSQLSGGQAQRVAVARALIARPDALICDEPVSALDMSLRAQVLELLAQQCREHSLALLFITHDLAAARLLCERTMVLSRGVVVEEAATAELFRNPREPYTRGLLEAMLTVDRGASRSIVPRS